MYADKKKSQKVYVESKCVSRDDCCWDETPETEVVVNSKQDTTREWPAHWKVIQQTMWPVTDEEQSWLSKK